MTTHPEIEEFDVEPGFIVKGPFRIGNKYRVFQKYNGRLVFVASAADFVTALAAAEKLADGAQK